MINGQKKGKSFEREIVHIFEKNFGKGFMRVPQSGAAFGKSNRVRIEGIDENFVSQMTGDLVVPPGFPFNLECKAYKDFEFHQVVYGSCRKLDEWLEQAESDAEVSDKKFLLIMKLSDMLNG